MSPTDSAIGQATPTNSANPFAAMSFVIRQHLSGVRTAVLVIVEAVSNDGGVEPVGTVDVRPLVKKVDGIGNTVGCGTVFSLPYLRLQGGVNAVILDPQVGDIGLAVVADRDGSAVVATKAEAPPGSSRRFSLSDGLYLGGFLNGTPQQYLRFSSDGVEVLSPSKVTIKAPQIELDGAVHVTGAQTNDSTIDASGDVTGQGTSLHTHTHSGVTSGGGTSGPPV